MAQQLKRNKGKKRKGKIKISSSASLVEKNDATMVARSDTIPRMRAQMPRTVAPVFKVKLRKKQ